MASVNYFEVLSFAWAALGIASRILMAVMGKNWNKWETDQAYAAKKPAWVTVVGVFGLLVIALDPKKMTSLNVSVIGFSLILIALGFIVY